MSQQSYEINKVCMKAKVLNLMQEQEFINRGIQM